jgi:hypothetical protein
MLLLETLVTG